MTYKTAKGKTGHLGTQSSSLKETFKISHTNPSNADEKGCISGIAPVIRKSSRNSFGNPVSVSQFWNVEIEYKYIPDCSAILAAILVPVVVLAIIVSVV